MKLRIEIDLTTAAVKENKMAEITTLFDLIYHELCERGLKPCPSFVVPDNDGFNCAIVEVVP